MIKEAQRWLNEREVTLWWDPRSKLTDEQVQALLKGRNAWDQALNALEMRNLDYIWEGQEYLLQEAAEKFGVDTDNLHTNYVGVDLNIGTLIKQSRGYFTLPLGIKHKQMPSGYEAGYNDYAKELNALGVNPAKVDPAWPSMPERDDPLIDPEEVWKLWVNNFYSGEWVALLDGGIVLEAAYHNTLNQHTVLKAGTNVTIHSYQVGSSSVLAKTRRALKVDPGNIIDDGNRRYGVQACCGLVYSAWNGITSSTN